ncbi:MAG: Gfo/Idh/MocA family oxidoreductase [Flavihumibacter sp.]
MGNRFVIIGAGRIARRHAVQIRQVGELVAVADPDARKRADFCREFPVPGFDDSLALLQQTDANVAVICSPNGLHPLHTRQALAQGLTVLCEKPFCLRAADAQALITFSRQAALPVYLVLSARYHQAVQAARQVIAEGKWGPLLSFQLNACWQRTAAYYRENDWHGTASLDGGILYTQFSHYIDALCWLVPGLQVVAVEKANFLHTGTIEGEDCGVALLKAAAGAIGALHWTVNATNKNQEISLQLVFEKATLQLGGPFMERIVWQENAPGAPVLPAVSQAPGSHHDLVYAELQKALAGEPHSLPQMEAGLPSVELIEAIYRAG